MAWVTGTWLWMLIRTIMEAEGGTGSADMANRLVPTKMDPVGLSHGQEYQKGDGVDQEEPDAM